MTPSPRIQVAIPKVRRRRAERETMGLPNEARPRSFDVYENEQTSAMITRQIEAEFGTFENLEAELDRGLAGQVGRTAAEMSEYMRRYCPEDD